MISYYTERHRSSTLVPARDKSLQRFTAIPEPGPPITGIDLVPSQYFNQLFQFIVDKGYLPSKDVSKFISEGKASIRKNLVAAKRLQRDFIHFMDSFVDLPLQFSCNWAEIFHTRLVRVPHVIETNVVHAIKRLLFSYIEKCSKDKRSQATILLSYLNTHVQDIDNSLIGLTPTANIISTYNQFREKKKKEFSGRKEHIASYTAEELLNIITQWASIEDNNRIAHNVRDFMGNLKFHYLHTLNQGDLVIAKVPLQKTCNNFTLLKKELQLQKKSFIVPDFYLSESKSDIVVARYCKREGDSILLWTTPDEHTLVSVKLSRIFPFNKDLLQLLTTERGMRRIIEDDIDKMNLTLKDNIKNLVNDYLQQHNIDFNLLERANTLDVSILDLKDAQKLLNTLIKLSEDSVGLLERVEHHINSVINFLEPNIPLNRVFHPTRKEIVNAFSSWPYVALASNRIRRYVEVCRGAMDQIHREISMIRSGKLKAEISEWWLSCIRERVYSLLSKHNYNFSAVQENYIDNRPTDINAIRQNLALVRRFLSPETYGDTSGDYDLLRHLVNPMKILIYPKLAVFERKLIVFLLMQPFCNSLTLDDFDVDIYLEQLKNAHNSNTITEAVYDCVEAVARDVEYLRKMKILEAEFAAGSLDRSLRDVVPVSGLALNYFHRMQMELKTIIEIWAPRKERRKKLSSSTDPTKPRSKTLWSTAGGSVGSPTKRPMIQRKMNLKSFAYKLPKPPQLKTSNDSDPEDSSSSGEFLCKRGYSLFEEPTSTDKPIQKQSSLRFDPDEMKRIQMTDLATLERTAAEDVIAYIQSPTKSTFKEVKDEEEECEDECTIVSDTESKENDSVPLIDEIEKKKENQEELKEEDEIIEENNVEEEEEKKEDTTEDENDEVERENFKSKEEEEEEKKEDTIEDENNEVERENSKSKEEEEEEETNESITRIGFSLSDTEVMIFDFTESGEGEEEEEEKSTGVSNESIEIPSEEIIENDKLAAVRTTSFQKSKSEDISLRPGRRSGVAKTNRKVTSKTLLPNEGVSLNHSTPL